MNNTFYIQVCLSDHKRDVAGMTAQERGVYEALRVAAYQLGGALPHDLPTLYRLAEAHTQGEKRAVRDVLERKFKRAEDGYRNAACDAEIERIRTLKQTKSLAAQERWKRSKPDAHAYADAVHVDMLTKNHKPLNQNQEPEVLGYSSRTTTTATDSFPKEGQGLNVVVPGPPERQSTVGPVAAAAPKVAADNASKPHTSCSTPAEHIRSPEEVEAIVSELRKRMYPDKAADKLHAV